MSRFLILIPAALLAFAGCAVDSDTSETPDRLPRQLSERPKDLDKAPKPVNPDGLKSAKQKDDDGKRDDDGKKGDKKDRNGGGGGGNGGDGGNDGNNDSGNGDRDPAGNGDNKGDGGGDDKPSDNPTNKPPANNEEAFAALVSGSDKRSDHGDGPKFADVMSLALSGSERNLRLVMEMAGPIPTRLQEGRVMGLGVDLFRSSQGESDFQIFLDGGADGWFAYLDTPRGFVDFPGTFGIAGDSFVVTVPWNSIGKPQEGYASEFADYSNRDAKYSEDFLPEDSRLRFRR